MDEWRWFSYWTWGIVPLLCDRLPEVTFGNFYPLDPQEKKPLFSGAWVGFPRKAKMELETGDTVDGNQKSGDLKRMDEKTSPIFGPFHGLFRETMNPLR